MDMETVAVDVTYTDDNLNRIYPILSGDKRAYAKRYIRQRSEDEELSCNSIMLQRSVNR